MHVDCSDCRWHTWTCKIRNSGALAVIRSAADGIALFVIFIEEFVKPNVCSSGWAAILLTLVGDQLLSGRSLVAKIFIYFFLHDFLGLELINLKH